MQNIETCGIFGSRSWNRGDFVNSQFCLPLCAILEALNHPQPPAPVKTGNFTALGYVQNNIQLKRSKSWDMRHYWLRKKENHQIIRVFWCSGNDNEADYFMKHLPAVCHYQIHQRYVQEKVVHEVNIMIAVLQGCVNLRTMRAMILCVQCAH